jgi:GntR family transcriptional regulator, carbon starvation induced regulator
LGEIGVLLETSGEKSAPLSEQALLRLRNDILKGALVPSLQLKLDTLKDHYGFSSSPLREALNRLTAEGLVVNEDRRGFFVAPVSIEDLTEITRLRCLLEPEALSDSLTNGDDAWEAGVISAHYRLERVENRLTSEKPFISDNEWAARHHEFHNALLSACKSEKLLQMRTTLFYQAERYWHLWANANETPSNRGSNHDRLRDAVLDRDIVRSTDLLKNHISQTTEIVVKYLEQK